MLISFCTVLADRMPSIYLTLEISQAILSILPLKPSNRSTPLIAISVASQTIFNTNSDGMHPCLKLCFIESCYCLRAVHVLF
jgi:hypothetical protein